jgi:hypothetical protein
LVNCFLLLLVFTTTVNYSSRASESVCDLVETRCRLGDFTAGMSLNIPITQHISCEDVVKIAEKAAEAILAVYDSKVSEFGGLQLNEIAGEWRL